MPPLPITQKLQRGDVVLLAKSTGLAVSTVSKFLNGGKSTAEVEIKILNAVADLLEKREAERTEAQNRVNKI